MGSTQVAMSKWTWPYAFIDSRCAKQFKETVRRSRLESTQLCLPSLSSDHSEIGYSQAMRCPRLSPINAFVEVGPTAAAALRVLVQGGADLMQQHLPSAAGGVDPLRRSSTCNCSRGGSTPPQHRNRS